jgi:hypothetical protein
VIADPFLFRYATAMKQICVWGLLLVSLSACASITADSEQAIDITTQPAGASCTISNSAGMWEIATTPDTVTVPRAFEPLDVLCKLPDGRSARTSLKAKTRGRAYGNILLLGLPTLVDASTGAGYEYEPSSLDLELKPAAK